MFIGYSGLFSNSQSKTRPSSGKLSRLQQFVFMLLNKNLIVIGYGTVSKKLVMDKKFVFNVFLV